jgi:hypothetical protein
MSGSNSRRAIISKRSTKPSIPEEAKLLLEDIYKSDVSRLQHIIGRPLPWPIITGYNNNNDNNRNRSFRIS